MADIEKRTLIIREDFCKKQDEFFAAIQKYVWIDDLKAVYSVSGGTEIVFVSQVALKKFLADIPDTWKVDHSESIQTLILTVVPRVGDGHAQISDATFVAALSQYGQVEEALRKTYQAYPTVETGARLFKIKPRGSVSQLPTSLNFGKSIFGVVFRGQVPRCHRCSGPHKVNECTTVVCIKCRKSGHMSSGCRNPITCTVCFRQGHSFKSCPAVREIGDITIGTKWTKPVVNQRQEGSDPNLENMGASGFSSDMVINDGHVRSKFSNVKVSDKRQDTNNSSALVGGQKHQTLNATDFPSPPWRKPLVDREQVNYNNESFPLHKDEDSLSDVIDSVRDSDDHVSETESDSETTQLDLVTHRSNGDSSSQDLFSSPMELSGDLSSGGVVQPSFDNTAKALNTDETPTHKRTRSLDRSFDGGGSLSKLTKS